MKKLLLPVILYLLLYSISFGQSYDMYISDGGKFNIPLWQILKFDESGNNAEVYIDQELGWSQDIVFIENQNVVLISNLNTGRITKYHADSGVYIDNFATNISGSTRMKIGRDSLLYVLQWSGDGKVLRYNLDGTFVDQFTNVGLINSIGIDWDSGGNLYISSYNSGTIKKYDSNGIDQGNFINSGLQGPTNIWFDENGDLFVNNWDGMTVKRFSKNGDFIEDFITGLSNPEGIAIFPNGNILIGDGGTSSVKLFDSEGNFIEDIIASGTAGLLLPNAVVLRQRESLAVKEGVYEINYLRSNTGNNFYLNNAFSGKMESLEVYDLTGEIVTRQKIEGDQIWSAENTQEGMYILKVTSKESTVYVQKVLVMHR